MPQYLEAGRRERMDHPRPTHQDRHICAETLQRDRIAPGRIHEIAHSAVTRHNHVNRHSRIMTLHNARAVMDRRTPVQERGSSIRRSLALRVIILRMDLEAT